MEMTPAAFFSVSAALLAGGKSSRMGSDKALVSFGGVPMWQRTLSVLQSLAPGELFVCGPRRAEFRPEMECIPDSEPNRGPLAGIASALRRSRGSLVIVLAVDMPEMEESVLRGLLSHCRTGHGCVPFVPDETGIPRYEPLAAVYPRECLPIALRRLSGNDVSMHGFVREAIGADHVAGSEISSGQRHCFRSVNTLEDASLGG